MDDQIEESVSRPRLRWQWSVRSLLAVTTVVAIWLGAWTFHYSAGILFTVVFFPACLVFILSIAAKENARDVKLWSFLLLVLAGAILPPLFVLSVGRASTDDPLLRMALASFIGLVLTTSYGIYILLMESVLELFFGRTETDDS